GAPGVRGFPDAAADRAGIEHIRLPRYTGDSIHATGTERADAAPAQSGIERRINAGLRLLRRNAREKRAEQGREEHEHKRQDALERSTAGDGAAASAATLRLGFDHAESYNAAWSAIVNNFQRSFQ